jgi:hypothetical protein
MIVVPKKEACLITEGKLEKKRALLFVFDTWLTFVSSLATAFKTVKLWAVETGGHFLVFH